MYENVRNPQQPEVLLNSWKKGVPSQGQFWVEFRGPKWCPNGVIFRDLSNLDFFELLFEMGVAGAPQNRSLRGIFSSKSVILSSKTTMQGSRTGTPKMVVFNINPSQPFPKISRFRGSRFVFEFIVNSGCQNDVKSDPFLGPLFKLKVAKMKYSRPRQQHAKNKGKWDLTGPLDVSKLWNCRHKSPRRGSREGSQKRTQNRGFSGIAL